MPTVYVTCVVCNTRCFDNEKAKDKHLYSKTHCKNLKNMYILFKREERIKFLLSYNEFEDEDEMFKNFKEKDVSFYGAIDSLTDIEMRYLYLDYESKFGVAYETHSFEPTEHGFVMFNQISH